MSKATSLHELRIPTDEAPQKQRDYSVTSGRTKVYFKHLEAHLIEHIRESQVVMGCVAWLTSESIIEALSSKDTAIVVQKEDFLRPDLEARGGWPQRLRELYRTLKCDLDRYAFPGLISNLSVCGDPSIEPIRCVGNHNKDKAAAFPRSHHKFVVFGKIVRVAPTPERAYAVTHVVPYAVWTGSYNFTKNAGSSFENAVYIDDLSVVRAYVKEFSQVFALSESLDWTSPWAAPEYRIGT